MKNVKRMIAGILAAIMMISSVPSGTVYAAEAETVVNENQADADEEQDNKVDIVEEDNNQADDVEEQDNQANIVEEQDADEISKKYTTEQISDENVVETEETEFNTDLTAAKSIDYEAVGEYIYKQLITERKKDQKAAEITVDVSSYKMPGVTNADMRKIDDIVYSHIFDYSNGDLYFIKYKSARYYTQQNIIAKITFTAYTDIDEAAYQRGLKAALSVVNDNMSDFQKMVVLHDYLVANCKYDKTTEHCSDTYGALVEGLVLCQGYANTYKYLLEQVGIECYLVRNENETHQWNLVKLDGKYYHVDVTQDDSWEGYVRHKWLLCSDAAFHERYDSWKIYKKYGDFIDLKATSTLYDNAEWKDQITPIEFDVPETYTITYVLNGGVNSSVNPATYEKGTAIQFKDPTREGYQFDGWYLNSNFTSKVTALSVNSSGDKIIYAKWTKIETSEVIPSEETSEVIPSEEEIPEKPSSEEEKPEVTPSEEETPSEETYTITYVLNGGINDSENPTSYVKGTGVEFKDPTREGYQFDGWYLNSNFTSKVRALSKNSSGNKTIYAKWIKNETPSEESPKTFKVTFDTNGHGTAPVPYTNIEAGSTIIYPTSPTADGYRFEGWYKNAACTKAWDFENDTINSNTTLYAKWSYVNTTDFDARAIQDMIYTGSALKPEVSVYDEETLLTAGKDYAVKYYNNVNANIGGALKNDTFNAQLPYVKITGKGNYTGTVKVNFNILKASISDGNGNPNADVTLKVTDSFAPSNKAKKPFSSIKYIKAMKQDVDFTLRLTAEDGKVLPNAIIPAGSNGTFTLEIIGKNNYEGAIERTIYVGASLPKNEKFAANTINVNGITDKVYTGKALVQENMTLTYAGRQLVCGTDYTVSYAKNVNKGTATMTFKGIERAGFVGSFKKTFKIVAADITTTSYTENLSASYSKAGAKPAITLTSNNKRLVNGKDYTLSYANNKAVGSGTITVKGKGNYAGSISIPFSIVKADLNNITVKTVSVAYDAKKAADYEYKPAIKLMDGKAALKAGVDYQIEYRNNTQAAYEAYRNGGSDTPCAIITAANGSAYKLDGEIVIPLPVYQNKLTKNNVSVKVEASECVYTGRQVKPSVEVRFMETELVEGRDYTVSYGENNVSGKNKGSVTISGIGPNYGGDVVVNFEINRKAISY